MSNPTFQLPSGYASVHFGARPDTTTESTTMLGAAIWKSFKYTNPLTRIKLKGEKGFVAGFIDQKAASAGAGGTKYDEEKITISCLYGAHATKTWPKAGDVITLAGATGDNADLVGDWSVVSENRDFAREQEADKGYDLERYCDVDLTP